MLWVYLFRICVFKQEKIDLAPVFLSVKFYKILSPKSAIGGREYRLLLTVSEELKLVARNRPYWKTVILSD